MRKKADPPIVQLSDAERIQQYLQNSIDLQAQLEAVSLARQRDELELDVIYDSAPVALCVIDRNHRYLRVNQKMAEINGVSAEEHIGKTPAEIVPDLGDQAARLLDEIIATGRPKLNVEFNGTTPGQPGILRTWSETWLPIKDENGQVLAVSIWAEEITERKKAIEALRQSEERYRELIELSPDAVFVKSGGRFVFVNPAALELFGAKSLEDLEGKLVLERIHPKDRVGFFQRLEDLYNDDVPNMVVQETFLKLDDTPVEVEAVARKIAYKGQRGSLVFVRDLTERLAAQKLVDESREALRLSEERFRMALNNTPIGVFSMDCDLRYTWVYNSRRETPANIIGKTDIELWGEEQGRALAELKRRVLDTREMLRTEITFSKGADQAVYVLHIEPLFDDHGELIGLTGASNEISAFRRLEELQVENQAHIEVQRRIIQQRELERVEIARDLHDGPLQELASIKLSLMEMSSDLPDSLRSNMDILLTQINQQIADLRYFCSELRPPALAPFGLEKAIRSHAETFQQRHPGLKILLNLMPDGAILSEDKRMALFRIYQELLNNIIKHAHADRAMVTLVVSDDEVVLEVEDNGVGFSLPDDWLELLRGGHLGLVGMRERVEGIGGRLSILSAPGNGTSVQITQPRVI